MNLSEIRSLFVKQSGRYDLITSEGKDKGADFFIRSGQRFLDQHSNFSYAQDATAVKWVQAREAFVPMPEFWLIREVTFLPDSSGIYHTLRRLETRGSLRYAFSKYGMPTHYIISEKRILPRLLPQEANDVKAPADTFPFTDLLLGETAIELLPHTAYPGTLTISGKAYSTELVNDDDVNTWSLRHPDLLLKSALYQLEVFYRNSEGAKDWLGSIQVDLVDLEMMEVLQDIQGKNQMRG